MKKSFKVVSRTITPGLYCSCIISRNGVKVDYEIGKKSIPVVTGTPLFVFRTLEDAVSFVERENMPYGTSEDYEFVILECEHEKDSSWDNIVYLASAYLINSMYDYLNDEDLYHYWHSSLTKTVNRSDIPTGTLFVASVTPIRIVSDEELDSAYYNEFGNNRVRA